MLTLPSSISTDYLAFYRVLPLGVEDGVLRVAAAAEPAEGVVEELSEAFGQQIALVTADEDTIDEGLRKLAATSEALTVVDLVRDLETDHPGQNGHLGPSLADVRDLANQPPVIRFVNTLIREAAEARASDIHFDATRERLRLRFRVDGVLFEVPAPPVGLQAAVISRLKLLAELDIAERRLPQDGRVRVRLEERELDVRVATTPTHFGESVTLRLLDRGGRPATLDEIGMSAAMLADFERLARRPHGILLATGPTGSGKTTTLHAALMLRDRTREKVITVEDPVEYELPDVTQVQVQEKTGMTFSRALRSLLRHDPDVLMVGEMRDQETVDIALRAAMTGHLVFSTLHTSSALGAIARLTDLRAPGYLIGSTIDGVLAQRLVRRVCDECRTTYEPDPQSVALLAERPVGSVTLSRGAGCAACRGSGFRGRTGLFELLVFDDDFRQAVSANASPSKLREQHAIKTMQTLRQDGWAKVQAGLTTLEEVVRVVV